MSSAILRLPRVRGFSARGRAEPPQLLAKLLARLAAFFLLPCSFFLCRPAHASSTIFYQDLVVGSNGTISASSGDVYVVFGAFLNASTQGASWNTTAAELSFRGAATAHSFTLAGADLGRSYFGYLNNFAWGTLRLAAGQALTLGDGNGTPGAAFYATRVILEGGVGQVASITGNGASIYYDPTDPANAPLLSGAPAGVYALTGGGVLAPVQAELQVVNEQRVSASTVRLTCKGVPGRTNVIEASPNLVTAFASIGSVNVDATGNFTFDDVNAGSFTKRFYRVRFP